MGVIIGTNVNTVALTTSIVAAICTSKVSRALCGAGAINVVEWTTVSKCQTTTLTQHQTRAVTYCMMLKKACELFLLYVSLLTHMHSRQLYQ